MSVAKQILPVVSTVFQAHATFGWGTMEIRQGGGGSRGFMFVRTLWQPVETHFHHSDEAIVKYHITHQYSRLDS